MTSNPSDRQEPVDVSNLNAQFKIEFDAADTPGRGQTRSVMKLSPAALQIGLPVGASLLVGSVIAVWMFSGGDDSSERGASVSQDQSENSNVEAVEPAKNPLGTNESPQVASVSTHGGATETNGNAAKDNAILKLLSSGATMSIDSRGQGQAVVFPKSCSFQPELLECLSAVSGLTSVSIHHPRMDDSGVGCLVRLSSLESISLVDTGVTDRGLSNLSQHPMLSSLIIEGGQVTGGGLGELASLRNLQRLRLSRMELSPETISRLVLSPSLRSLDLSGSTLSDNAARVLAVATNLQNLDLEDCGISEEVRRALAAAIPNAKILPEFDGVPAPVAVVATAAEVEKITEELTGGQSKPPVSSLQLVALPGDEIVRNARSQVHEILKKEYAAAKTRSAQKELSRRLFELADDFERVDPARFVILDEATQYALRAADWEFAVDVVEELGRTFDVNLHAYHSSVMTTAARICDRNAATNVCQLAIGYADSAVDHEHYAEAAELAHASLTAARRANDASLTRQAVDRAKEISASRQAFEDAEAAKAILKHKPDDKGAHHALGQYLALHRRDWTAAIPHLSASNADGWDVISRLEEANPAQSKDQVQLAEQWVALAATLKSEFEQASVNAHASDWLRRALPNLSGLEQVRITRLLASLEPKEELPEPKKLKPTKKLLASNPKAGLGRVITTELVGGPGGAPFKWMVPTDAHLVGFRISASVPISMIQPIYQTDESVEYGPVFGEETTRHVDLVANRGYQVAGLVLKSGDFIKGLTVTFAEIKPKNRLRPRWYDSRYVGDVGAGRVTRLGSSDILIVGFHGRGHSLIDALGLVGRRRVDIADSRIEESESETRTE